ncbi:hypothetical protein N7493_003138 [Penicillium malachiteum]|uniref:Uncharacterized protein n=1 Tax=Penicillium malachiteum TaxID=1324776 RepID=A0AAD6MZF6_9EURO|nr:hypothetical protein N7493_003138 [Penicillium malachiteum]
MAAKKTPSEEKESEQPCQRCFLRLITKLDHVSLLIPHELREEAQRAMQGPKCQLAELVREVRRKIIQRTRRINMELRIEAAGASSEKDPDPDVKEEGDMIEMERLFEMAVNTSDYSEESDLSNFSDLHDIPHFSDESDGSYESGDSYDAAAERQLQDSLAEACKHRDPAGGFLGESGEVMTDGARSGVFLSSRPTRE